MKDRKEIVERLAATGYVADGELATAISLMQSLRRPLLLEGAAGVGKTEVAKALASLHATELIRLQCYEGLDVASAVYEWNSASQMIAAYKLEVHEDDLEWDIDGFRVKGLPEKFLGMKDICWIAYNSPPPGMEPGLEAVSYYDPPNMTYPFGAYLCVMDIDVDTGVYKVRRFYALDDCGTRINPMIIEGQVHGGLTEAFAIAMGQEIHYDETGNVLGGSFMDFFLPTAVETPHWETDFTVTPSPHHPIGAKGVGESPNVGGVPAFSNAVNDAFSFLGATHIQMPHDFWRNWKAAKELGAAA
jgi:carbon-monoxide dehydrogenase large subunit